MRPSIWTSRTTSPSRLEHPAPVRLDDETATRARLHVTGRLRQRSGALNVEGELSCTPGPLLGVEEGVGGHGALVSQTIADGEGSRDRTAGAAGSLLDPLP